MLQFHSVAIGKWLIAISLVVYIVPAAENLQQCLYIQLLEYYGFVVV